MLGTLSILIVAHVFLVLFPTPDLIMYHSNMHVSLYVVTLLYRHTYNIWVVYDKAF